MIVLRLENIYSYLVTDDQALKNKLWSAMRFRDPKFWAKPSYRQGHWDGFVEFFNKRNGRFLSGLRPEVEYALKQTQHVTLYDYQTDLINQSVKYKRGLVKAPTGAGKTKIFIGIMRALPPGTPTLVLTDTIGLTEQNYDVLKTECEFDNVGLLHGKSKKPNVITCSTVQSVAKLEKLFPRIKVVIVDEVHACMSKVPCAIYRKLKSTPVRIGISATPFKDDATHRFKVRGYFGPVLKTKATESGELTTLELQKRGILSGSECCFFELNEPQLPYEIYQDAVKFGIAHNHHLHDMVKELAGKLTGRTLILVERLDQGDALHAMIPGSHWIQGVDKIDAKKAVIEKLRTDDNVVAIVSQKIISKGIDVKIHNLINAAGGKAEHSVIQRMGRGLRTAGDKDILKYYDFLFNINDYLRDHSEQRIKCLQNEGHPVAIKEEFEI
jgi:superfamily II DNA or RNA helicase